MEVNNQLHVPAVLPPESVFRLPVGYETGWTLRRSGLGAEVKSLLLLPEIELVFLGHADRSLLSYSGSRRYNDEPETCCARFHEQKIIVVAFINMRFTRAE
jgi:hypothetical protein